MKLKTRTIALIVGLAPVAIVVGVIAYHVVARIAQSRGAPRTSAYTVGEVTLKRQPLERFLSYRGVLEGDPQVKVYPTAPGQFIANAVNEGDYVAANQVLATIDRAVVGQTYEPEPVRSPVAGLVTELFFMDRGAPVAITEPVAEVANTARFKVMLVVGEEDLSSIRKGMEAMIAASFDESIKLPAVVSEVTPVVDPDTFSGSVTVSAVNKESRFKIGMSVVVTIITSRGEAFVVPLAAVQTDAVSNFVFLDVNGTAKRVTVTEGFSDKGMIEISGDLEEGELVITDGAYKLFDGARVVIAGAPGPGAASASPSGGPTPSGKPAPSAGARTGPGAGQYRGPRTNMGP
jgi:membrane fusion protein (multidrug efflux system)